MTVLLEIIITLTVLCDSLDCFIREYRPIYQPTMPGIIFQYAAFYYADMEIFCESGHIIISCYEGWITISMHSLPTITIVVGSDVPTVLLAVIDNGVIIDKSVMK